jgi:hypothetical protein
MVGMAERSDRYELIEARLAAKDVPVTFEAFIAERRPHKSWRTISADIAEATGVPVSHTLLRRWFADRISYEVTVR